KLDQYAAVGGAQSLAQSDLARALTDRHQHDVHDTNGAQGQGYQSHSAQEHVHGIENLAHHLGLLNRIQVFEGVFVAVVETVIAGDALVDVFPAQQGLRGAAVPV